MPTACCWCLDVISPGEEAAPRPGPRLGGRHHLAAVADAFLPVGPPAKAAGRTDGGNVYAAAPGGVDTAGVLSVLCAGSTTKRCRDLGGGIADRLRRWERDGRLPLSEPGQPVLIWCPIAEEALSLVCTFTLGRLGALLQPEKVTLLWFAGSQAQRSRGLAPAVTLRARAVALAGAAVPAADVVLHCLGWDGDAGQELRDLARRFAAAG
ncbi:MAG: hypothetical protein RBT60_02760 [Candidatus Krumholzibacteria bacterium]|nr:hypothetical protein [Candidatus Krumholzibacteria bacterium]